MPGVDSPPPEVKVFKVMCGIEWVMRVRWFTKPDGSPDEKREITIALEPRT